MALEIRDNNFNDIISSNPVVVIDFWAEWCGPCRMITPVVEEVAEEFKTKAVVGKVNVDDNPQVTMQFGIKNIPTLLFFKNGQLADKHVGVIRKPDLVKKINENLNKDIKPEYAAIKPGDIKHSFAAIVAAEKYLGYKPSVLFDEGLKMTIDWYNNKI
jgi:thioredoxin 1